MVVAQLDQQSLASSLWFRSTTGRQEQVTLILVDDDVLSLWLRFRLQIDLVLTPARNNPHTQLAVAGRLPFLPITAADSLTFLTSSKLPLEVPQRGCNGAKGEAATASL